MTLIDIQTLKDQLEMKNVSYDLSDEQLELLLQNTITELTGYTNLPLEPKNHKYISQNFKGNLLEVDFYPVESVTSLKVGSTKLTDDDYVLDSELGILYFDSMLSGMLVIEYVACVSDDLLKTKINPLLIDMITHTLSDEFNGKGNITSMKEGDVSVNFDKDSSLGSLIQSRIKDLKGLYSIRIKVL